MLISFADAFFFHFELSKLMTWNKKKQHISINLLPNYKHISLSDGEDDEWYQIQLLLRLSVSSTSHNELRIRINPTTTI